jgi:hypothetical protein
MATVTMIDASHRNKQESLDRQEIVLKDHQDIHGEIIRGGNDHSNPIEADWETSSLLTQQQQQLKQARSGMPTETFRENEIQNVLRTNRQQGQGRHICS